MLVKQPLRASLLHMFSMWLAAAQLLRRPQLPMGRVSETSLRRHVLVRSHRHPSGTCDCYVRGVRAGTHFAKQTVGSLHLLYLLSLSISHKILLGRPQAAYFLGIFTRIACRPRPYLRAYSSVHSESVLVPIDYAVRDNASSASH